jgi:hypothetical protein
MIVALTMSAHDSKARKRAKDFFTLTSSMSATARSETICIRHSTMIQAKVTFSGLSNLSGDKEHLLAALPGDWEIVAQIPKAPLPSETTDSELLLCACPPSDLTRRRDDLKVILTMESMKGDMEASHTFSWGLIGSAWEIQACGMIDWDQFWHKNAEHRSDDGFCVMVKILWESATRTRPLVKGRAILSTLSELSKGHDVLDTQFLLFSQPRPHNDVYGAKSPLPVYASSAFLRSQSEYFDTSMFVGLSKGIPVLFHVSVL